MLGMLSGISISQTEWLEWELLKGGTGGNTTIYVPNNGVFASAV
jgi:hypothetical protein